MKLESSRHIGEKFSNFTWARWLSRYSDWLRPGRSGDRNPVGSEIFRTCPDRPWDTPSPLYNVYRVFHGGKERPGRDADSSPPSSAVGHERVELYLYSPCGPYGLYRASVPVKGCSLPLLFLYSYTKFHENSFRGIRDVSYVRTDGQKWLS
jgi:hypothetical protein